jgi:hypothetical protein
MSETKPQIKISARKIPAIAHMDTLMATALGNGSISIATRKFMTYLDI